MLGVRLGGFEEGRSRAETSGFDAALLDPRWRRVGGGGGGPIFGASLVLSAMLGGYDGGSSPCRDDSVLFWDRGCTLDPDLSWLWRRDKGTGGGCFDV